MGFAQRSNYDVQIPWPFSPKTPARSTVRTLTLASRRAVQHVGYGARSRLVELHRPAYVLDEQPQTPWTSQPTASPQARRLDIGERNAHRV